MAIFAQAAPSDTDEEFDLDTAERAPQFQPKVKQATTKSRPLVLHQNIDQFAGEAPETSSQPSSDGVSFAESHRASKRRRIDSGTDLDGSSSDDWTNDGAEVYKRFKSRKSEARKKALKSSNKARAAAAEAQNPTSDPDGQKRPLRDKTVKRKTREYGDLSVDDAELMEWTTPEYVQKRRRMFDDRAARLKAGGLQLPPSYEDVELSDDDRLGELKEKPAFDHINPCSPYKDVRLPYSLGLIPAPIAQWLREYQVKGTEFLHELFVYQKGGILGDDMGLGKTVQVIAFLTAAYGKTGDERDSKRMRKARRLRNKWYPRTLIICPGTLMDNWAAELDRWGWWHWDKYHKSRDKEAVLAAAQSGRVEVVITTYDTYKGSKDSINLIAWDCVIADECHVMKDRRTETAKAMNDLNALCRIGLTGTAIQNKYEELWTLLNWTNPGQLGPISTWKTSICIPLKMGQSHDASVYQLALARKTARKLVENLLPQFFLRRMKTLIKDQLPKKTDRVVFCPMTETQAAAYENFLDSDIVQYIKYNSDLCDCLSGKKRGWCCYMKLENGPKWQAWVFPAISVLQKLSNHVALLIPHGNDHNDKIAKDLDMLQIAMPETYLQLYAERDHIKHMANPDFCGKWRVLKKLLKFWHDEEEANNKVLVFSHSVRLLKMLQTLFVHTEYNVKYLDGSMKYDERSDAVRDFNTDPSQFVFLISTKAGGIGLNITSANKVVVVDPNWNPSYDLQAQDRAYRIGQLRDVEVFRLVSQGTLEEIVYARQIYKQQQASIGYSATSERRYFQGVQDQKEQKGELFGLNNLFKAPSERADEGGGVLKGIVNKTNVAESRADVRVIGLEVDEESESEGTGDENGVKLKEEDEDAAMSQLAAEIIGDGQKPKGKLGKTHEPATKKHDPVAAILASVGVQYTHENSEVIGSSKVEAHLSKRAEEVAEAGELKEQETRVFFEESQSQAKFNDLTGVGVNRGIRYKYKPPVDVQRRQFFSMAKWAGYEDVVEFALVVEGWTQNERREWLSRFYRARKDMLLGVRDKQIKLEDEQSEGVKQEGEVEAKAEVFSDREDDEL